jgi:hypothetical protein
MLNLLFGLVMITSETKFFFGGGGLIDVSINVVGTLLNALSISDMKQQDWLGLGLQRYQI